MTVPPDSPSKIDDLLCRIAGCAELDARRLIAVAFRGSLGPSPSAAGSAMVDQDTRAVDAVLRQYGVFRGHPSRRSELAREVLERGWSEELVASEAERILRSYDSQGDVLVAPKVLVAHLRTADPDAVREDQAVFEQTLERIRRESAPRPQTSRGTATGMPDHYQLGYVTNPLVRILGLTPPLSDDEIRQAASDPRITGSLEQLAWFAHRSVSAVAEALGKSA